MQNAIITRFAPSPTGFLHIGGARTALFNWLFAKANNGKMLLRIEDTDKERSTDAAINAITDGLTWLGINWTGDTIFQSANVNRHREIAEYLVSNGKAYKCYATRQELDEMRAKAEKEGKPPQYDGRWRDRDPTEAPVEAPYSIRIKSPIDGVTLIDDQVQGQVEFPNKDLDDFIILRSNGTPTYMLAVVVDDHDMEVSHIIRGVDHLTNAARQVIIYNAMSWNVPIMAHVPLIHGQDGTKLSKRHGALGVDAYRDMGYLPIAMLNYLARLGWSHGDDEIFSVDQMTEWFEITGIGKSPAQFDFAKLENINGHYIREANDNELIDRMMELQDFDSNTSSQKGSFDKHTLENLKNALPQLKLRAKSLVELFDSAKFIWAIRPLEFDDKAQEILNDEAISVLQGVFSVLKNVQNWSLETLETEIRNFAGSNSLKLGKVAQPLRASLTGRATSQGIFDVLLVLGKSETLARIGDLVGSEN